MIPAPSLANNLLGEKSEREILVYLPPSYGNPDRRFPVVYVLPGFGNSSFIGFSLPESMDGLIRENKIQEMMVVVNGINRVGGSFNTNLLVTGNWEDFFALDVVAYIDVHYRTITPR